MERENRVSVGGMESDKDVRVANKRSLRCSDLVLRFVALALTLAAAVVLGVDKQTTLLEVTLVSSLPPVHVPVTAKWHYLSAFVYFVVANAIACSYAAVSLLLTLATRGGKKNVALMIIILDLVMVALLFSGNGATMTAGLLGYQGNKHVQWNKVCDAFGKFCNQVGAAIAMSMLASLAFLLLVLLAALNLHKKHK
ncbi:hypothetical protein RJ639_027499 [Escallonia herrerae]|uniref:CASP-like protein n=1 Tax=Escallonia herrerae TaxID=1293975 RepID=A0AA89BD70_9ASTE|nr:hypothetical protein RJ639_027499 [Escallonia herrerae]